MPMRIRAAASEWEVLALKSVTPRADYKGVIPQTSEI
jgi:hypothetical protein